MLDHKEIRENKKEKERKDRLYSSNCDLFATLQLSYSAFV